MTMRITIEMDNDAFEPYSGDELARILRRLADSLEESSPSVGTEVRLMDANGNHVGECVVGE